MLKLGTEDFTTGRSLYSDHDESWTEPSAKIWVRVKFPTDQFGAIAVLGELDTGAPWSILHRELAEALGALQLDGEVTKTITSHGRMTGKLVKVPIEVVADHDNGQSLRVDATVFVSEDWTGPTLLGYSGLLEALRFALDPPRNHFYFGRAG
jgi:hypothetical protein